MANRSTFPTSVSLSEHKILDAKGKPFTPTVGSNAHAVQVHSDYSIWDTTAGAFVKPEDTNVFSPK